MKQIKKLAGQTVIYGMGTMVPRLMNYLLLTPFYTRIFMQGEYGVVTELYAYAAFLMVLLTYGMETAYFRFAQKEQDPDRVYGTALYSLLFTSLLFIISVVLFSGGISTLIRYPANPEYIIYFAIITGVDAFTAIPFARLRQQQRPVKFAFIRIITVFINIAANLFFLLLCPYILKHNPDSAWLFFYDPTVGVGYAFISNLIASLAGLLLLWVEITRIRWIFDKALLKRMLSYAWPLLVIGLAGMVNEVLDKILLKYLLPDQATAMAQLGIYGANYKLAVLLTLFIQMFRFAAEPFFFAQEKEENSKDIYAAVMKYFVIFCIFIYLGVMLFLDLVKYIIGPAYHEGLGIVPIVLAANLFMGIFYNLSIWYKLSNLTLYGAVIAVTGAVITLLMNIVLIPRIGYWGSAWGHFGCYLVMMVFTYLWGKKYLPVNYDLKRMGFYFLLAAVLLLARHYIPDGPAILGFTISLVMLSVYLFAAFLFERREFGRS